jgi:hypothetical protein
MSSDRSRRRESSRGAHRDREDVSIDQNADDALRSLVRVLAREAAREFLVRSSVRHDGDDTPKGER